MPIEEHGYYLHKGTFVDALALRYGWLSAFTPWGGFHRSSTTRSGILPLRVCNDVCVEPDLREIIGEVMTRCTAITTEGARLDNVGNGFWGGRFGVIGVFNPYAPTNYRKHELEKKQGL